MANDTDDDGTIAVNSVQIQAEPNDGTATTNEDGTVTYTLNDGFAGIDSFSYVVRDNDGQFSEPATVEVTVNSGATRKSCFLTKRSPISGLGLKEEKY